MNNVHDRIWVSQLHTYRWNTNWAKVSAKRLALDKGFSVAKRAWRCQHQGQLGHPGPLCFSMRLLGKLTSQKNPWPPSFPTCWKWSSLEKNLKEHAKFLHFGYNVKTFISVLPCLVEVPHPACQSTDTCLALNSACHLARQGK